MKATVWKETHDRVTTTTLLRDLIAALAHLPVTGRDDGDLRDRETRVAEFARLRGRGLNITQASREIGVCFETGRRYEQLIRRRRGFEE